MKRKSLHPQLQNSRSVKKIRTYTETTSRFKAQKVVNFMISQTMALNTIENILANVQNHIHQKNLQIYAENLFDQVKKQISIMYTFLSPEEYQTTSPASIQMEKEPCRVSFDPMCGFDRLITYSNQSKKEQFDKLFKKDIPSYKTIQKGNTEYVPSGKRQRLVPLGVVPKEEEPEIVERDRRLYEARTLLMNLPTGMSEKSKRNFSIQKKQNLQENIQKAQEYFYCYDGKKQLVNMISKTFRNKHFNGSKILKTLYKINNDQTHRNKEKNNSIIPIDLLKRASKSYQRSTVMANNKSRENTPKQSGSIMKVLTNKNQVDEGRIKVMIQTQIKKNNPGKVKWKEKPEKMVQKVL